MEGFDLRLREARGTRSQKAVADMLGIKQQAYARYETGRTLPGTDVLHKICCTLNVSADWLLGLPQTPAKEVNDLKVSAMKGAIQAILDKF